MPLPLFFIEEPVTDKQPVVLNEDTSRHIVQVLRMQEGGKLELTDGKGNLYLATVTDAHKKKTVVTIGRTFHQPPAAASMAIGISLVKNNSRFEWFLEKATELGIGAVYPLLCDRTEKQNVRPDRMRNILISALLQSRQTWLPVLHEPLSFREAVSFFSTSREGGMQKFIAHCEEGHKQAFSAVLKKDRPAVILIGPEGDFTPGEIGAAMEQQFTPVALGGTRLRTETAGMAAAVVMKL